MTWKTQSTASPDSTTILRGLASRTRVPLGSPVYNTILETLYDEAAALDELIRRVVTPLQPEDAEPGRKALFEASIRMPDREDCAKQLAAAMGTAPVEAQCAIVEILGAMGGTAALERGPS